jgi:hypothetical protein
MLLDTAPRVNPDVIDVFLGLSVFAEMDTVERWGKNYFALELACPGGTSSAGFLSPGPQLPGTGSSGQPRKKKMTEDSEKDRQHNW